MTSTSYKLEPVIWSRGTGQGITWFDRCQLIITRCHKSKKYKVNQGCMSLSTYYLEDGSHLARLHRRRRRRRAYAPTSNTASHDNYDKINSWVSLSFLAIWVWGCAWRPFGPPELRYYNSRFECMISLVNIQKNGRLIPTAKRGKEIKQPWN